MCLKFNIFIPKVNKSVKLDGFKVIWLPVKLYTYDPTDSVSSIGRVRYKRIVSCIYYAAAGVPDT